MPEEISLPRLRSSPSTRFLTEYSRAPSPEHVDDVLPHSTSIDYDESLGPIEPRWKRQLYELLEEPNSSSSAFVIYIFLTGLIVLSALVTVLETVPAFHSFDARIWFGFETSLVALFTMEYIARSLAWSWNWKSLSRWLFSFLGFIDLLAILPYYIELMLQKDTSVLFRFSILRMFRLLRVFRPFRYNHTILLTIEVMFISIRRSQHALLAIGFFITMILTVFSTLLYFAERGTWDETLGIFINSDGDPTQFSSIPAAGWFVIVTISTVGYGEITPRSFLGRLITVPLLVVGLLLIALPSFVLGREFSLVWEKMSYPNELLEDEPPTPLISSTRPRTSLSHPHSDRPFRDLTNLKLAENQTELSRQITELRVTVDSQADLIKRLTHVLERSLDNGAMPNLGRD